MENQPTAVNTLQGVAEGHDFYLDDKTNPSFYAVHKKGAGSAVNVEADVKTPEGNAFIKVTKEEALAGAKVIDKKIAAEQKKLTK